jgi:hypothetical protein
MLLIRLAINDRQSGAGKHKYMNKIQVRSDLSPEVYQQLQQYMTEKGLSETTAIEVILDSHFSGRSHDELMGILAKMEQDLSYLKRHVLAVRFRT